MIDFTDLHAIAQYYLCSSHVAIAICSVAIAIDTFNKLYIHHACMHDEYN